MAISGVQQPTVIVLSPNGSDMGATVRQEHPEIATRTVARPPSLRPSTPDVDESQARQYVLARNAKRSRDESEAAVIVAVLGGTIGLGALAYGISASNKRNRGNAEPTNAIPNHEGPQTASPSISHNHGAVQDPSIDFNAANFSGTSFQEPQVALDCPLHAAKAFLNGNVGNGDAFNLRFANFVRARREQIGEPYTTGNRGLEHGELADFLNSELERLHHNEPTERLSQNTLREIPASVNASQIGHIERDWSLDQCISAAREAYLDSYGIGTQEHELGNVSKRLIIMNPHAFTDSPVTNSDGSPRLRADGTRVHASAYENRVNHFMALAWNDGSASNSATPVAGWRLVDSMRFPRTQNFTLDEIQPRVGPAVPLPTHESLWIALGHYLHEHLDHAFGNGGPSEGRVAGMHFLVGRHPRTEHVPAVVR